jgi:MASE7 protein
MEQRKISEKDARRLRALQLASWLTCVLATVSGITAYLESSPTATFHILVVAIFALVPLLARRAPLSAAVVLIVWCYIRRRRPDPRPRHHRRHRARTPARGQRRLLSPAAQAGVAHGSAHHPQPAAQGARALSRRIPDVAA